MRIRRASIASVTGSMPGRAENALGGWVERHGLLLRIFDDEGRVGRGEASPLPDYSPDTVEQARAELSKCPWEALPEIDESGPVAVQVRHAVDQVGAAVPSARFAVETALLDLVGQRMGRPISAFLSREGTVRPVPLATVVDVTEPTEAVARARAALDRGVRTFKVKIGRPDAFDQELELLRVLRGELGRVNLRVDANGALPEDDLEDALHALADVGTELVEEPTAAAALARLERSPVPIALDESLQGPEGDSVLSGLAQRGLLGAVVLKPTALGGLLRCAEIARHARAAGVAAVVSHTLDGPIALAAAAALAVALPEPRRAAGLDRHPGLDAWPEIDLPILAGGRIEPSELPGLGLTSIPVAA